MPQEARHYRWSELTQDQPMERIDRRLIRGERVMIAEVTLHQGCFVEKHRHDNEQVAMVMRGKIRFRVGEDGAAERELVLGPGEVLHFPSNVPHGAEALEDSLVLDVFSPVSEGTGIDQHHE